MICLKTYEISTHKPHHKSHGKLESVNRSNRKTRKQKCGEKTVWILQVTDWQNCTGENLDMTNKRKLHLSTAQNNAIRTNCIKAKIDNMQQNGMCSTCNNKIK